MARRRQEEFYCTECRKYFLTYLRDDWTINATIECPNEKCKHHHFRVIKEGLVTGDRHKETYGTTEIIMGLKSTLRDAPWHDDPDFRRQQLKVYNGGK